MTQDDGSILSLAAQTLRQVRSAPAKRLRLRAKVLAECEVELRKLLSPESVDARAKKRQAEQLERYGGRQAVIARGDLGFSPPPGVRAEFH